MTSGRSVQLLLRFDVEGCSPTTQVLDNLEAGASYLMRAYGPSIAELIFSNTDAETLIARFEQDPGADGGGPQPDDVPESL